MPRSCPVSRSLLLAGAAGLLLSLPACSNVKQALGIEPSAPDEFQVVARAPLSMPPDYTLRPPRPGAHRAQDAAPTDQARQTVFHAEEKSVAAPQPAGLSPGEAALRREAGIAGGDSDIRQLITRDNAGTRKVEERGFVDGLLFWQKSGEPKETIDPAQEARRLQQKGAALPEEEKPGEQKPGEQKLGEQTGAAPNPPESGSKESQSENPIIDRLFR